ncbi:FtsW/RodA/SpoVE family cell cycle protein [Nanchangia anserum]|uniref:FtsW/RodA/SpoVE family cell cycle protein n=1 Tax=Nanchangia anserum TaxID=2692125 RepID=A0A8I0KNY9_9ACTO|nr:FtsW/RodA/SpoVE family cell cycle protein [Nanchangia anserum]MBD3689796.1 FtsW/RodA/SpoVE family cell cycle protein [Nanchangia anserum]QOX81969.1 FtsW/RodA/SpoVE family cell cycle protein [Nanchangia anserum]
MASLRFDRAPTGRLAEICLLIIAFLIGTLAFASTMLNMQGALTPTFTRSVAIFFVFCVVAHLIVRYFAPYADPVLLPCAVALNGLGVAMIYRLDISYRAVGQQANVTGSKQLIITLVSIVLMAVTLIVLRDHRQLRRFTYTSMVLGIVLLLLPVLPGLGSRRGGAQIWIDVFGFTFQPSEIAKICFAVFFAGYLVARRDSLALGGKKILGLRLPRLRDFGPIVVVWILSLAVLVLQRDLGTSLLLFGLFVALLYVATNQVSWLAIGAALFLPAAWAASKIFSHVGARFEVWLDPFNPEVYNRATGGSWQLVQGLFGMANGGMIGTGWGHGYPWLVSQANSDFIYASLAEETGLSGALVLLLIYLVFVERGMRVAVSVRDGFGKLLASGLAFAIGLQVFVVVGGVTRLIPLTGLTLPFVAAGGSSLLANWMILAILLRISHSARRPATPGGTVSTTEINLILDREAREKAREHASGPRIRRKSEAQSTPSSEPATAQEGGENL